MASNMQLLPRMLKMLRENSSIKEKREALTYIRSNSKKLTSTGIVKEEQCKELCKLVVDAFASGNNDIQNEAYETLNVIIQDFKQHTLNLFEAMLQINQKNRLKILKLLEIIEDNAISTIAYDVHAIQCFTDCMSSVQANKMPWIAPTACVDNLQALMDAENKTLSDDQRLEEETVNYCIIFLRRLYKLAAATSDINIEKFDALLLDKVMLLAYMGHKRQRGPALKLLQQALATNILSHVRSKLTSTWTRYKSALQTIYCKRMLLLVSACELDWAAQWNISVQYLGVDLHKGAGLINDLLSIEEKAFKSTDTITRRQAFLSWKLLVDNFALDPQELATARRIKLLCIPLNAKNSKTELIAITKLEVWWHVIVKLYKDISRFVNPVLIQFLNFCFGPLGDTPLLSSKCEVIASPGKRFYKTKIIAVDALCQLLVTKHENHVFSPILEERLPHSMTDVVFQQCYKSVIHSVGEALLILSQLTDTEMKNRYQLSKILWTNLINYVQESKMENKENMHKDVILVTTELANYVETKPMIKQLVVDLILFEIANLSKEFNFQEDILSSLMFKLLKTSILNQAKKNHYNALKSLLWQCIKSSKDNTYYTYAFNCIKEMYNKLYTLSNVQNKNESVILELWLILTEVLMTYMDDIQEINEGSGEQHDLRTVESIVMFPFMYMCLQDQKQIQEITKTWKRLCTHLEMRADLIESIKTNEILMNIARTMQHCLTKNKKSYHLIISCLDILLGSIDYKLLLTYKEVPPIMSLIVDLIIYFLCNNLVKECDSALKALSAVVITIYGHNPKKVISYLQVCKPAVELMLTYELSALYSEIASTWESIVSVLKGLGILIDANLISSYKKAIVQAVNHSNCEIQEQAMSLFELKNVITNSATLILEEIEKEMNEKKRNETNVHTEKLLNQDKTVDNFLKESNISKRLPKQTDDYVFIKTDLKFDVCRLTEHQKESLKRKREDIPALYNDLSQSSSQDTQNLQEWFDRNKKVSEEAEKVHSKNVMDDDANKENKVESETSNKLVVERDTKTAENIEDNVSSETIKQINDDVDNTEDSLSKNEIIIPNCEHSEVEVSMNCTAEDLNFSIQKESSMSTDDVQRLSPSILNSGKRYDRSSISTRSCISQKLEEVVSSQSETTSNPQTLQKKLKTKAIQCNSDIDTTNSSNDTKNKIFKDDKKGIKRKSASDSESDGSSLRQRRKTSSLEINSDTDSCKSTKSDTTEMCLEEIIDSENLSQRTRNEISRLRINMVFDSPLSDSRRSYKNHKDKKSDKKIVSEIKTVRGRGRPRSKRLEENNEFNKTEGKEKILKNKKNKVEEDKMKNDMNKDERVDIANSSTLSTKHDLLDTEVSSEVETVVSNKYLSDNGLEIINDETNEKFVETNNENIVNNQDNSCTEEKLQTQDDTDDIIESSQNVPRLENKCNEKQCTTKVNNTEKVLCMGEDENINLTVSNNWNSNNIDISENNKEFEKTHKVSINESNISTPVTEKKSGSNEKTDPIEAQKKDVEIPLNSVEFTSPKSNPRNQSKFKSYSTQGRAAHMLGLVTKQARIEAGCQIIAMNDEPVIKKARSKDTDPETPVKKERVSTCSSRQEKIFNNMKSSDYCSSSPIKLFSNLKNEGEKFVKADNSVESMQIDVQDTKVDKTIAEIDELPLLGWPSANSPSLNASPSVSILKRQRQLIPEPDPESTTPNKRKRVSFADPPVSKEVGYEITSSDFTHKTNKLISRGILGRKDSPLRLKQIRQKSINIDTDKVEKDEGADVMNVSDIDLQCEKENELLTKMAEELEYSENVTINTDVQASYNTTENELTNIVPVQINGCNQIKIDHLSGEFEITQGSIFSKYTESTSVNKIIKNKVTQHSEVLNNSNINSKSTDFNDSATQEDIFIGTDTKCNAKITETKADVNLYDAQNASIENNLLDSHRFNDTKESTINHSSEGHLNTENLEDTVDAENLTRLNSTANSDEIFCGNLIRTSTQTAENIQEQDTLPVTDSIFGSLPLSQDSQNTSEFHVKIPHPELLNSIYPIYSPLILCQEPIDSITHHLTNPLWVRHLTAYFASRNLQTVGDLARLSEREINRIPVKGNSKVEFVKGVLKSFEKKYAAKEITNSANNLNDDSNGKISSSVNISTPGCIEQTTSQHQISQIVPASTHKKIVSRESNMQETTSSSVPIPHSNSLNVITTQMMSGPVPSMVINSSSQNLENYNFFAASGTSIGCSTKTIETCTSSNSISSTKSEGNKTTRSVAAQMALEDLLDEIDLNLVLESAVRRCTPERILLQYKNKMKHIPQVELEKETVRILGSENVKNCTEVTLKAACRACGVNKVLLRLPDIFSSDKQFFSKVLNAYKKKINVTDCLNVLDFSEVKNVVCKKCTSSELAEMLSNKLKDEEQEGIREPMTELSSLNAMLKRMPMDLIISHTVANEELIPSRVVLDIALQNNSTSDIVQALECQSSSVMKDVFEKLLSSRFVMNYTERLNCKQDLLKLFKVISSKLSEQDLLQAFYESMSTKVTVNQEK